MRLVINNIGKIKSADIRLDGLTVICGNNNSGKSTVGKVLFSCFNSFCDVDSQVVEQKCDKVSHIAWDEDYLDYLSYFDSPALRKFVYSQKAESSGEKIIANFFVSEFNCKLKKKTIADIVDILKIPNKKIEEELVYRFFSDIFNEQIKTINAGRKSSNVTVEFKDGKNKIVFYNDRCDVSRDLNISHNAYYIDNPFSIDVLNSLYPVNNLERNLINAIKGFNDTNKKPDVIDSVTNKELLESVRKILTRAYTGKTEIKNGMYQYSEGENSVDVRNISTGLKSFAIIERLLESGKLRKKDVLIFDEPEIHLHPEWQLVYAELLVVLQKTFDLTVLINTHSMIFLQALNVYCRKYDNQSANYYLSDKENNSFNHIDSNDISAIYSQTNKVINELLDEEYELEN